MILTELFAIFGALSACLLTAGWVSPHIARILAALCLTWADALEDWKDSLSRHWHRHAAHLLEDPRG